MRVVPAATELTPLKSNEKKEEFISVEIDENNTNRQIQTLFSELISGSVYVQKAKQNTNCDRVIYNEFAVWKTKNPKFLQLSAEPGRFDEKNLIKRTSMVE